MNINITDINSAAIKSLRFEAVEARYDEADKLGTLVVTFANGGSYAYQAVSVATMRKVLASDSIGSAVATLVKPAHAFAKVSA